MATTSSSSRNSSYRRPKLLRSYITAPTQVTSYASHNDRCTSTRDAMSFHSASRDRATTILNRVASYGYSCSEKGEERRSQFSEKRNPSVLPVGREAGEKGGSGKSKNSKVALLHSDGSKNGAYFSFPSFEEFENFSEKEQTDAQEEGMKGVARRHSHL